MALKRGDILVPPNLGQVVLVLVVIRDSTKRAARGGCADAAAFCASANFALAWPTTISGRYVAGGNSQVRVAIKRRIVRRKRSRVVGQPLRQVIALL